MFRSPGVLHRARRDLIRRARELPDRGLVTGTVGNLSMRCLEHVLITPTRVAFENLRPADAVTVGFDGARVAGRHAPSQELAVHLAIYRARSDAQAILHCHSPLATAWSFLGQDLAEGDEGELLPRTEELNYYGIGAIRVAARAPAGSTALAAAAVAALRDSRAVLLADHGVVTVASTPREAIHLAHAVEHQARVAWLLAMHHRASGLV